MKRALSTAPAALALLLPITGTALGATGCTTEAYCFDCSSGGGDAGLATTSSSSGSGGAGGSVTATSSTGQGGEGGGIITCTADTMNDPKNCGLCGNVCNIPNAFPVCTGGFCLVQTCAPGWLDLDSQVANGCEYSCSPSSGGVEICDGLDNDCNGLVDELSDIQNDPFNCGACSHVCSFAHASPLCTGGACVKGPCLVGYYDANASDADGCELACTPTNGGVEVCDNADNDCDGQIDEGFDLTADPENCGSCGTDCGTLYPHTMGVCAANVCQFGPCAPGFSNLDGVEANGCEYACVPSNGGVEICDGLDNDCNGLKDDGALAGVGDACGASSVGECKLGAKQCQSGALVCVGAIAATVELCDGKDNNCSGATDEGCPAAGATDKRLDVGVSSAVGQAPSTQLAVTSRGDLVLAAYLDRRSGNSDIRATVSSDGGLTWLTASDLVVATGASIQVEPSAALGLTSAYVSYGQFNAGNDRDVYVARAAPPFTAVTSTRADKDATGADAFFIRSAVAQAGAPDKIVVVWESLKGSGSSVTTDVYLQASTDGGVTWKAADLRVNGVAGVAELPVLATDGAGRAFLAWRDQRAANAEVYADVYDFATGALAGNKAISGGHPGKAISITADAGGPNVYIAWTDLRAAKKAIRVNRSVDSGSAFAVDGVVVNPDSTFADADAPAIVSRAGNVVVAWEDTRSGLPDIRVNHSSDAGATWLAQSSRADLGDTPGVSASTAPSLAFGAGSVVYVTWEDARSGQRDIYANHSFDAGTTFQPFDLRLDVGQPGAPSPFGGADSRAPFTLANAAGTRGVAVWIDYRTTAGVTGVNADIYSNLFQ